MGQTNDCKHLALFNGGYVGQVNDMWHKHLKAQGLASNHIADLQSEFLDSAGIPPGNLNDRWGTWLWQKGYVGSISDRWNNYWCDVANDVPGNPGLPVAWLLNASFDSYLGVTDQSLVDGQVLGQAQGVQVGGLLVNDPGASVEGITIAGDVLDIGDRGTSGTAGANNVVTALPQAGPRGRWFKGAMSRAGTNQATYYFFGGTKVSGQSNEEPGFGLTSTEGLGTVEAGVITHLGVAFIPGYIYSVLIILDDAATQMYADTGTGWELVKIVAGAPTADMYWSAATRVGLTGEDQHIHSFDVGADATAILDAGAVLGPVSGTTAAQIDALKGDIVSASFGPAETVENVLSLTNQEVLAGPDSVDYATRDGDIRRGTLIYQDAAASGPVVISGGVAQLPDGGAATSLTEKYGTAMQAGLSVIQGSASGLASGTLYPLLFGRTNLPSATGAANAWCQHQHNLGTSRAIIRVSDGATWVESITIVDSTHPPQIEYEYGIVAGGFTSGVPDPVGIEGALFLLDGMLMYSTTVGPAAATLFASANGILPNLVNSMRTKIDLPKLATPWRGLLATDHANAEDYVPENGPSFAVVKLTMEVRLGQLKSTAVDNSTAIAVYDNPGGGYWEQEQYCVSSNARGNGFVFRYLDNDNYWVLSDKRISGVPTSEIIEIVATVENIRASSTTSFATGADYRSILTDDGETITAIYPTTGVVLTHSSTAGAERTVVGCFSRAQADAQGINWHCARMGTVKPYLTLTLLSEPGDYNLTLDEYNEYDYSVHFSGTAPLTYSFGSGDIPGMTFDTATGILSGTPTTEAGYPRHAAASNAAGNVATALHTITVEEVLAPPVTDARLLYWVDATDISTLFVQENGTVPVVDDGDLVGFITDKSASGLDVTQIDTGKKMTYRAAGLNGLPSLQCDGADDLLFVNAAHNFSGTTNFSAFVVVVTDAVTSIWGGTVGGSGSYYLGQESATAFRYNIPATATLLWKPVVDFSGAPTLCTALYDGVIASIKKDGVLEDTIAQPGAMRGAAQNTVLGGFDTIGTWPLDGFVSEYLLYQDLTAQEILDTEAYLMTKWGIA